MTHSVAGHLSVEVSAYDAEIRRFIPGYQAMLDDAMDALVRHVGERVVHVLDLGAGTGALTQAAMGRLPTARFTLLDADAAMLEQAELRLARDLTRVTTVHGSFFDPLPACDVAMASLSLHHVHEPEKKRALYENIRRALAPGGALLTCDAMVSSDDVLRARTMERFADHLVAGGDTRDEAFARFASWADEDRYFALDEELELLASAGFTRNEVVWRAGPLAVVVALA